MCNCRAVSCNSNRHRCIEFTQYHKIFAPPEQKAPYHSTERHWVFFVLDMYSDTIQKVQIYTPWLYLHTVPRRTIAKTGVTPQPIWVTKNPQWKHRTLSAIILRGAVHVCVRYGLCSRRGLLFRYILSFNSILRWIVDTIQMYYRDPHRLWSIPILCGFLVAETAV